MPTCGDYAQFVIRTQIQLTDQQLLKLRRAAHEQGVSLAEIVRRCIDRAIDEEIPGRRKHYSRATRLAGAFTDHEDAEDVAREHDAYLERAFE
jgi:hypothetical protein